MQIERVAEPSAECVVESALVGVCSLDRTTGPLDLIPSETSRRANGIAAKASAPGSPRSIITTALYTDPYSIIIRLFRTIQRQRARSADRTAIVA